jgi:hypothetical protein
VGARIHPSLEAAAEAMIGPEKRFKPQMAAEARDRRLTAWNDALAKV